MSAALSMANVTFLPLMLGVTPELAEQSMLEVPACRERAFLDRVAGAEQDAGVGLDAFIGQAERIVRGRVGRE